MGKLQRNKQITLVRKYTDSYDVLDRDGIKVFDASEDYQIYFKNAKFNSTGDIKAIYLGEDFDSLIDGYARSVNYNGSSWNLADSTQEETTKATLVGVKNNVNTVIIIKYEKDDVNGK